MSDIPPRMRAIILSSLFVASLPAWGAQPAAPEPLPATRYESIYERSPFALATPPEPVAAAAEPSFAANWVLKGLATLPDEDGVERDFVIIRTRDLTEQIELRGNEPGKGGSAEGVTIASIERSPEQGKSRVQLQKDGKFDWVEFSQDSAPPPPPPPGRSVPPMAGQQPATGMPSSTISNPNAIGASRIQPNSGGRISVPRPSGAATVAPNPSVPRPQNFAPGRPGASAQPGANPATRPRVRVINSKP